MSSLEMGQAIPVARAELCCWECATRFTVDVELLGSLRARRQPVQCPAGHAARFHGSTAAGAVQEELDRVKRDLAYKERRCGELLDEVSRMQRSIAAHVGVNKRLRRRLAQRKAGVR